MIMQSHLFKALPFELDYFQGEISSESSAIKPWVRPINKRNYTIKPKSYFPTNNDQNQRQHYKTSPNLPAQPVHLDHLHVVDERVAVHPGLLSVTAQSLRLQGFF